MPGDLTPSCLPDNCLARPADSGECAPPWNISADYESLIAAAGRKSPLIPIGILPGPCGPARDAHRRPDRPAARSRCAVAPSAFRGSNPQIGGLRGIEMQGMGPACEPA